ncbi:MAG: PhzF family phenazine biosynthesis protein [Solirubrobacteraceae bacterium]|nr:PhzF family phenazine biosynthesis protein [Solirubrobacteraceae bacterium]
MGRTGSSGTSARRPVTWLDVFTATPLTGNQLAVVHDADGLDDATMLAFARETRLSETTFVQASTQPGADYRNRIWSMPGELPFAGHPSLGTAVAVARARGERVAHYVQQTPAGLQPIDVQLHGDDAAWASMLQEPPTFGDRAPRADVMAAAGLRATDAAPGFEPQVVSTGQPHLMAVLRDLAALNRAAPDAAALRALLEPLHAMVLYLAAVDLDVGTARARGFFLDPDAVTEDPATGSAAGPLLAYLREHGGHDELTVVQGIEIGRASALDCAWEDDRPRVSGDVVVVGDGHLLLGTRSGS